MGDPEGLKTMFKVLRMGEDAAGLNLATLGTQGKINIEAQSAGYQNIFQGAEIRAYRIECLEGGLQIYLDGSPVEEIRPGQSTDVEAKIIRVKSSEEAGAKGVYTRIQI